MSIEEFLSRLDAKLDLLLERMDERDARWDERDARWEEQAAETRRFHDELFRRNAQVTEDLITAMREGFAQQREDAADMREQIRANTEATWRMLDRFGPEPQS